MGMVLVGDISHPRVCPNRHLAASLASGVLRVALVETEGALHDVGRRFQGGQVGGSTRWDRSPRRVCHPAALTIRSRGVVCLTAHSHRATTLSPGDPRRRGGQGRIQDGGKPQVMRLESETETNNKRRQHEDRGWCWRAIEDLLSLVVAVRSRSDHRPQATTKLAGTNGALVLVAPGIQAPRHPGLTQAHITDQTKTAWTVSLAGLKRSLAPNLNLPKLQRSRRRSAATKHLSLHSSESPLPSAPTTPLYVHRCALPRCPLIDIAPAISIHDASTDSTLHRDPLREPVEALLARSTPVPSTPIARGSVSESATPFPGRWRWPHICLATTTIPTCPGTTRCPPGCVPTIHRQCPVPPHPPPTSRPTRSPPPCARPTPPRPPPNRRSSTLPRSPPGPPQSQAVRS